MTNIKRVGTKKIDIEKLRMILSGNDYLNTELTFSKFEDGVLIEIEDDAAQAPYLFLNNSQIIELIKFLAKDVRP